MTHKLIIEIKRVSELGLSQRQIGRKLGISQYSVHLALKDRYNKDGSIIYPQNTKKGFFKWEGKCVITGVGYAKDKLKPIR